MLADSEVITLIVSCTNTTVAPALNIILSVGVEIYSIRSSYKFQRECTISHFKNMVHPYIFYLKGQV